MNILGYEEMAYDGGTRAREFLKKKFYMMKDVLM